MGEAQRDKKMKEESPIPNVAAGIVGTVAFAAAAYSSYRVGENVLVDRTNLRYGGLALASSAATFLLFNKVGEHTDRVGNATKKAKVISGVLFASGVAFFGASFADVDDSAAGGSIEIATTAAPSSTTVPEQLTVETVIDGHCSIVAPIPANTNGEVAEDVKILQAWLNENGYEAGPVDGFAPSGGETSQAIDRLQEANRMDPARPWDEQTCSVTGLWTSAD